MSKKHELIGWDKAWSEFCKTLEETHTDYPEWLTLTRYVVGAVATNHPDTAIKIEPQRNPQLASDMIEGGVLFVPIYSRDYCLGVCYRLAELFAKKTVDSKLHFIIPAGAIPETIYNDKELLWYEKSILRKGIFAPSIWFRGVRAYIKSVVALASNRKTKTALQVCIGRWKFHLALSTAVYYWEIACAKRFLKKHKIQAVVTINDLVKPAAAFVAAANHLNIPSVVLQHGVPGPQSAPFMAKQGWVWGASSRALLCDFGADEKNLEIIGNLEIDHCRYETSIPPNENYELLLLSQWRASAGWGEIEFQDFFTNVAEAANLSKKNWKLKIRLHPNEDEQVKQQIIARIEPFQLPYEFSKRGAKIEEDISSCDMACTVSSSAIMHAIAAGKPSVVVMNKALESRLGAPLLHSRQVARSVENLMVMLNELRPLKVEDRETIIANFGNANENAAKALWALVHG